jgi:hypothetical protein
MEHGPFAFFKEMQGPVVAVSADPSEWLDQYKRLMGNAIAYTLYNMSPAQQGELWWECVTGTTAACGGVIRIYERLMTTARDEMHGSSACDMFLVRAIVQGRADRYAFVAQDLDPETRLPWDGDAIASCQQMETYRAPEGDIHVCQVRVRGAALAVPAATGLFSWLRGGAAPLVDKILLGITTKHYSKETETHSVYFTTAPHYHYGGTTTTGAVHVADAVFGMRATQLEDNTSDITMFVRMEKGMCATAAAAAAELLHRRVLLYERVVNDWDKYYGPLKDPKKYRK